MRVPAPAEGWLEEARPHSLSLLEREAFLVALLAVWGLALVAIAPRTIVRDSWMTLVAGREVAQHGIPHVETLTALAHGRTWIDQQWLAQLAFFGAWKVGGINLVALVSAAAVEAALVCGVVAARLRGATTRTAASASMLALLLAPWALQLRAQSFALVLFVLLYWLLSADSRVPSKRILLSLPLLALWANIHGSVVLGAGLVVLKALTLMLGARPLSRAGALRTLALLVGAPAAIFASPYGFSLVHYYRLMLFSPPFGPYITEWKPTTFDILTVAFFVFAFLVAILAGRFPGRITRFEEVSLLCLAGLSLTAERNIVWFSLAALVSTPVLFNEVAQRDAPQTGRERRTHLVLAAIAAVIMLVVAATGPFPRRAEAGPTRAGDAIAALASHDPDLRIFPNDAYGDWLLWQHPELEGRVAYDVRFELLTAGELKRLYLLRTDIRLERGLTAGYRLFMLDHSDRSARRRLLDEGAQLVQHEGGLDVLLIARRNT